jgi:hypothetical protein
MRQPLKVGIALSLASLWFAVPSLYTSALRGVWMGLTICFVISHAAGASIVACANRMLGTMLAAVFSIFAHRLATAVLGAHASVFGTCALLLAWVAFAALWRGDSRIGYLALVAAFTPPALLFGPEAMHQHGAAAFTELVLHRVVMTTIGVVVFLAVELLLWPVQLRRLLRAAAVEWLNHSAAFLLNAADVASTTLEGLSLHPVSCSSLAGSATSAANTNADADADAARANKTLGSALAAVKATVATASGLVALCEWEPNLGLRPKFPLIAYDHLLDLMREFSSELASVKRSVAQLPRCRAALEAQARLRKYFAPVPVAARAAGEAAASAASTIEKRLLEARWRCPGFRCQGEIPSAPTDAAPQHPGVSRSRSMSIGSGDASVDDEDGDGEELVGFIIANAPSVRATTALLDLNHNANNIALSYSASFYQAFPKAGDPTRASLGEASLSVADGDTMLRVQAVLFSLHHLSRTGVQLGHWLQLVMDRELSEQVFQ